MKKVTLRQYHLTALNLCARIAEDIIFNDASLEVLQYAKKWAEIESPMTGETDADWIRICYGSIYVFLHFDAEALYERNKFVVMYTDYQYAPYHEGGGEIVDEHTVDRFKEKFKTITNKQLKEHFAVYGVISESGDYSTECPRKYKPWPGK